MKFGRFFQIVKVVRGGGGGSGGWGVLTGGPVGPGGPLLSWVQVQALGKAGQSSSFRCGSPPPHQMRTDVMVEQVI